MDAKLIKNGLIHAPDRIFKGDILIQNGKIDFAGDGYRASSDIMTIDASGKWIFPGGIDPHVHMELPSPVGNSSDDFLTGSKAAIAGGATTIIDFVTPGVRESFIAAFKMRKELAKKCLTDYAFHVSPTWWGEESETEMEILVKEHGVTSFKCYMAYHDTIGIDDEILEQVMKTAKKLGVLVTLHCEDDELIAGNKLQFLSGGKTSVKYHPLSRPPDAEVMAVQRAIRISGKTGCKIYIVHVSTAGAINLIRKSQRSGMEVYAETCPQYLLLDDSVYSLPYEQSAKFVICPPLRKISDQQALWEAIADGTVQTLGTDHCPFNLKKQKEIGKYDFSKIPCGAGGVEHRLGLLYTYGVLTGRITIDQFIKINFENPASVFGIRKKGAIKPGYDADLVLWDNEKESIISVSTHNQNCDTNIYEGMKIKGKPEIIFSRGSVVYEHDKIVKNQPGEYLPRRFN